MSLILAFCCLLAWFTFTQRVSTELALREGFSIYSLDTDGGERPVGCIYTYTNGEEFKQGVGPCELEECIQITDEAYRAMKPGAYYSCPLGLCRSSDCKASGLTLKCWKPETASVTARHLGQGR
uniref:Evasin n=1 Tax=Amblyomma americanum TaxID=6943 RepID=A0A0C9SEV9_AMBAM